MKIFTSGLVTETNTFAPFPTGLKDFQIVRPIDVADGRPFTDWAAVMQVFREEAEARGWEFAFGLHAVAEPAGTTVRSAYETLRDEILVALQAAMPVDAVLLDLHGAMVAQGYDDCEEDIVSRVRDIVGPDVIIGIELDLHCHVLQSLVDTADVICIYKEYPHTDILDRAHDLVKLVAETHEGKINPTMALYNCQMVGMYLTPYEPMRSFVDDMFAAEGKDRVLSLSLAHCFPWGDVPHLGTKMLAITDGNIQQAANVAASFGKKFVAMRHEVDTKPRGLKETFDEAVAVGNGPVVIADATDNPGGGAPSDSTTALREMLDRGLTNTAIAMIWDPVIVNIVMSTEVGAILDVRLGGKLGPMSGDPLDLQVEVVGIIPQMVQDFPQPGSEPIALPCGDAVALRCQGIDIIVNSLRGQVFTPQVFTNFGIDVRQKDILVVKSTQHFYAAFAPIASKILYMDAGGALQSDYPSLPYRHDHSHKYPWIEDPIVT
ncbi:MAG: microcystin LR degradation protein MlrC-like protein [Anaerolineaceae bacterium]|nr:microcystin LR degradation protein MlrC-like protein [Anaerolineaceae bacterium]